MTQIILYTIHCPQCNILKKKLDSKGIKYTEVTDRDRMKELGIVSSPILSIDGELLPMKQANDWINAQGGK